MIQVQRQSCCCILTNRFSIEQLLIQQNDFRLRILCRPVHPWAPERFKRGTVEDRDMEGVEWKRCASIPLPSRLSAKPHPKLDFVHFSLKSGL